MPSPQYTWKEMTWSAISSSAADVVFDATIYYTSVWMFIFRNKCWAWIHSEDALQRHNRDIKFQADPLCVWIVKNQHKPFIEFFRQKMLKWRVSWASCDSMPGQEASSIFRYFKHLWKTESLQNDNWCVIFNNSDDISLTLHNHIDVNPLSFIIFH